MQEAERLRPKRWWSWVHQTLWGAEDPPPAQTGSLDSDAEHRRRGHQQQQHQQQQQHPKGLFFPFLTQRAQNVSSAKVEPRRSVPSKPRGIDPTFSEVGKQRADRKLKETLRSRSSLLTTEQPLVWTFFRERMGWGFVGNTWNVCGPPTMSPSPTLQVGRDGMDEVQQRGGRSIPWSQLPTYLADHAELLQQYEEWKMETSAERAGHGNRCNDGSGSDSNPLVESHATASIYERRTRRKSYPSVPAGTPLRSRTVQEGQSKRHRHALRQQQHQRPAPTKIDSKNQSCGHEVVSGNGASRAASTASDTRDSVAGGVSRSGDSTLEEHGGSHRGVAATPPPALRTRSRLSGVQCATEPRRSGRGAGAGAGRRTMAGVDTTASRVSSASAPRSPRTRRREPGNPSSSGGKQGRGGNVAGEHTEKGKAFSEAGRQDHGRGGKKSKVLVIGVSSTDAVGSDAAQGGVAGRLRMSRRASAVAKRRRSDLCEPSSTESGQRKPRAGAIMTGLDQNTAPLENRERRGRGSRERQRRSSTPEAGTPESGHEQSEEQPPLKKARIKLEKDRTDSKGTTANTPPSWAPGRREIQSSESLSTVAPGEEDDDPLAVYARIEAETVNDEGLEALLHSSKRSGYLDLRRYRKPGWPRPLRITRLEASHGKRFEEYLNLLLREKRRVEATVLLRRLAHFDRNPPHLAAAASGRGRAACVPAWYQELAVTRQSATGTGGGEIEEVLDLTAKEVEVVECYDNEPLDCVMMTVVKQEPGLEEEEEGKEKTVAVGFDQKASGGCATLTKDSVNVLPATLSLVKKELG